MRSGPVETQAPTRQPRNTRTISAPIPSIRGMTQKIAATPSAAPIRHPVMRKASLCTVSPVVASAAT